MGDISDRIKRNFEPSARAYEWFRYEEIAPVANARTDYDRYSSIKINKFDKNGDYVEIPLVYSDCYQRLADPLRYLVLVKYVGSGRDAEAVGQMVRKDLYEDQIGTIKTAQDNNVGVI